MKKNKVKIYERKDGMVKVYNGHLGTFVWEKQEFHEEERGAVKSEGGKLKKCLTYLKKLFSIKS